jgi:integrase
VDRVLRRIAARLARDRKRAAMGIYRRGRIYHIDFSDQNRRRIQESSHSTSKRDAEKLLALRKSEVLRGVYHQPVRMTLGELEVPYMEYAKANKRSWLRDQQMLKPLKEFFGADRQLTDITPADIEGYKLHRRKQVSGSTVNRELALLKRIFNLAIDWDFYVGSNPVRKVKFFQEFNTGRRILTPSEEENLVRHATPHLQDIILFALNTGLRIGEIFILLWPNVDWENGVLNVFAPKTGKIRAVPMNSETRRILEVWARGKRNEFVFYNYETGKPFVDLSAGFALACRKAGISGVTWHTLRHTFASRLLDRGVDIVTVKELLGHSTVLVTMRYLHPNLQAKMQAVAKLAANCDNSVTVRPKVQQLIPKVSQIGR